jgi:hypothetical protein
VQLQENVDYSTKSKDVQGIKEVVIVPSRFSAHAFKWKNNVFHVVSAAMYETSSKIDNPTNFMVSEGGCGR